MNIIELAREAGLYVGTNISGVTLVGSPTSATGIAHIDIDEMTRFAALVRAAALEEAAGMCDAADKSAHPADLAAAIRELKERT